MRLTNHAMVTARSQSGYPKASEGTMMTADASNYLPQPSRESVTSPMQARGHQVCDQCGGRFGLVTYRWWGNKFCKRVCKNIYLREVWFNRDAILRWFGFTRFKHRTTAASALCVR
jgi:hypothetical protein